MAVAVTGLMVSCQKESDPVSDNQDVAVKYATEIPASQDHRDIGVASDWLSAKGSLSELIKPNLPTRHPEYFVDVPEGIKVTSKTYIYLTLLAKEASFDNLVGFYTYKEGDLTGDEAADRARIVSEIFVSSPTQLNIKNVVSHRTRGDHYSKTIRLDNDGEEFEPGTIIGFYLMPNSGNSGINMSNGKPIFIATDKAVNTTVMMPEGGKVSHIMGVSACNDVIVAFEDLNSMYSKTSDEDYNDLVFLVGDNLYSRDVTSFETYGGNGINGFGLECTSLKCDEAANDLDVLKSQLNKATSPVFAPAFTGAASQGFMVLTQNTNLYAHFEYMSANFHNTVGWYAYTDNMTEADIKSQILNVDGSIKEEHIIYKEANNSNIPTYSLQQFGFPGELFSGRIAFFILPKYTKTSDGKIYFNAPGEPARYTSIKTGPANHEQAQLILKASCNTLLVAFEDKSNKEDDDYNDIIFTVTDNPMTLSVSRIVTDNFYSLKEINDAF